MSDSMRDTNHLTETKRCVACSTEWTGVNTPEYCPTCGGDIYDIPGVTTHVDPTKTLADVRTWMNHFENIVGGNHARRRCQFCWAERWVHFDVPKDGAHDATPHNHDCPKRALARFIGWETPTAEDPTR